MIYLVFAVIAIASAIGYELIKKYKPSFGAYYQTIAIALIAVFAAGMGVITANPAMCIVSIGIMVGSVATYKMDTGVLYPGIALFGVSYAIIAMSPPFSIWVALALCIVLATYLTVSLGGVLINNNTLPLLSYLMGTITLTAIAVFHPQLLIAVIPILLSDGVLFYSALVKEYWWRDLVVITLFAFGMLALVV